MVDFEKGLNPSQLEVVRVINGALLVIAGAGSGKTRVIEYRVLHFIRNNIPPESILLLTFTRKAAQQMLYRAARHDLRCSYVEGGTFHSFAYRILKRYACRLGFDEFFILDELDAEEAIQVCLDKTGFSGKEKKFPRKDTLRKILSMSVNKNMPIEEILENEYPGFSEYCPEIERIKEGYIQYKISKKYLDYDDLLVYLRELLSKNEDIRSVLSEKYKYIMVDEYQDTNKLQADITYFLGSSHHNVMAVGDDAQSIYGFRGASHENIMDFPRRFSGCRIIKLEANYRSSQSILDVANAVLKDMKSKYSKTLHSASEKQGDKPQLLFFKDNNNEAEWIASKIEEVRNEGVSFSQQAVLFRSAYISIPLQMELRRRNIPYQVFGGMKFYETAHVKDLLSHLKVVLNNTDELSWNRVLMLIGGIGSKTAARIIEAVNNSSDFETAIDKFLLEKGRKHTYSKELLDLIAVLKEVSEVEDDIKKQVGILLEYYHPLLKNKFDDWGQRDNDLEALLQISSRYESLSDFLADFALDPPEKNMVEVNSPAVTLSTIHSAKGLEWECVFLIGLVEGILPVSFSLNDENGIEEEKRLFYVGLTRAMSRLFLSLHYEGANFGMNQFNKISRFLDSSEVLSKLKQDVFLGYDG